MSKVAQKNSTLRKRIVTGDTRVKKIRFEDQDEGEDSDDINLIFQIQQLMQAEEQITRDVTKIFETSSSMPDKIFNLELMSDPDTPNTLHQALNGPDAELWRQSAIAEINNFLKRNSWKFVLRDYVVNILKRKEIATKWVFKIKSEPDYSLRYKSRVVTKGYMQIPGVDYTEKFSPVAQPTSVRAILAIALYFDWITELVNIEAAFLEGRLKVKTYDEQENSELSYPC